MKKEFIFLTIGKYQEWVNQSIEVKNKRRDECMSYFKRIKDMQGKIEGNQLKSGGYSIAAKDGGLKIDGPFSETKEVLNGYIKFSATSMEEAVELLKQAPFFDHNETVQLFELTEH